MSGKCSTCPCHVSVQDLRSLERPHLRLHQPGSVSLHTWANERMGKTIEIGMGTYFHLLYSYFLAEGIRDDNTDDGLKDRAIICLAVGWVVAPLIVCLVLCPEKWVKFVVARHLKDREEENVEEGQEGRPEALEYVEEDEEKIGENDEEKEMM